MSDKISKSKPKILAVDDDANNLEIVKDLLGDQYEIQSAMNAKEALDILKVFRPALILLDIMMPGMDGYELCRQIRLDNSLEFTKVLYLSAKGQVTDRLRGYTFGGDDYLTKPFDHEELMIKINTLVQENAISSSNQFNHNVLNFYSQEALDYIHGINGFSELLMNKENLSEESKEVLNLVMNASSKIQENSEYIILLHRVHDEGSLEKEPKSIASLLMNITDEVEQKIVPKKVEIFLQQEEDLNIRVNPRTIRAAFILVILQMIGEKGSKSTVHLNVNRTDHAYQIKMTTETDSEESKSRNDGLNFALAKKFIQLNDGQLFSRISSGSPSVLIEFPKEVQVVSK